MSNLVFISKDKYMRAEEIVKLLNGKAPKTEHETYLKERFTELLQEQVEAKKLDMKKKDDVLVAVYKILGGAVQTVEQVAKRKAKFKKAKTVAKAETEEAEGKDDEDEEEDDDE